MIGGILSRMTMPRSARKMPGVRRVAGLDQSKILLERQTIKLARVRASFFFRLPDLRFAPACRNATTEMLR
jgi:hypothetical protein